MGQPAPATLVQKTPRYRLLFDNFEAEFLNDGVGEDVLGDTLHLGLGFVASHSVECEHEEFSLTNVLNLSVTERAQRALNCLSLGIEDGGLQHDPNVCFHLRNYTSPADLTAARKSTSI